MSNEIAELYLLSKSAAEKFLGVRKGTMGKLIESGKIRFIKINKRIKIPIYELKRFIEENLIKYNSNELEENEYFIDIQTSKDNANFNSNKYFQTLLEENSNG